MPRPGRRWSPPAGRWSAIRRRSGQAWPLRRGDLTAAADAIRLSRRTLGGKLAATIDAINACALGCTACADACLSDDMVADLTKCARTNLDCADICATTANVLSRHTGYDANITRSQLEACATACKACGDECARHAKMHEHCKVCAEACRACEQACRDLLATIG